MTQRTTICDTEIEQRDTITLTVESGGEPKATKPMQVANAEIDGKLHLTCEGKTAGTVFAAGYSAVAYSDGTVLQMPNKGPRLDILDITVE